LVIAIDLSKDGYRVIAIVGAKEHVLKNRDFDRATTWVRHFREIGSDRKKRYLSTLPRRFKKIKQFLELSRICFDVPCAQSYVYRYRPLVILVDDKLFNNIDYPRKVRESKIKEHHRKRLMYLADNLANYFRIVLKDNPRILIDELKEFEK